MPPAHHIPEHQTQQQHHADQNDFHCRQHAPMTHHDNRALSFKPLLHLLMVWVGTLSLGCTAHSDPSPTSRAPCPTEKQAHFPLPGLSPTDLHLNFWLQAAADLGPLIYTKEQAAARHAFLVEHAEYFALFDLNHFVIDASVSEKVTRRFHYIRSKYKSGEYRSRHPLDLDGLTLEPLNVAPAMTLFAIAQRHMAVHCIPRANRMVKPDDPYALDRNRCSSLWPGDTLAARRWDDHWSIVFTSSFFGFVPSAHLSENTSIALARPNLLPHGPRAVSRRDILSHAFAKLGTPYGWGGEHQGLDCSRFIKQVFEEVGLLMPRTSRVQIIAAEQVIEVPPEWTTEERLRRIDDAHQDGIVLLHFPGHIMLYLGRNAAGAATVIHAFLDYKHSCPASSRQTRIKVARVALSTLDLAEHSMEGSLLERIDTIGIIAPHPNAWPTLTPVDITAH